MIRGEPKDWTEAGFEDVRDQERRARQEQADFVANMRQAIALCDGVIQLEASGGFKLFQQTLADMLEHRTKELLSAREDRAAAVMQGRCQELRAVLAVTREARGNREALAKLLADSEDRWIERERSFRPSKPPEEPTA